MFNEFINNEEGSEESDEEEEALNEISETTVTKRAT